MRPIRASEIGAFLYCRRAWWYQQRGIAAGNPIELAEGAELHEQHGRAVVLGGLLRTLAYGLLMAALVMLTIYLTNRVL